MLQHMYTLTCIPLATSTAATSSTPGVHGSSRDTLTGIGLPLHSNLVNNYSIVLGMLVPYIYAHYWFCVDSNMPKLTNIRSCSGEGIVYTSYFTCTSHAVGCHCVNCTYSDTSTTSGNGVVSSTTSGESSLRGNELQV